MRLVILLSLAGAAAGGMLAQTGSGGGAGGPHAQGLTGAPYSAEAINERVQTLADGTHITQPVQKTKFYRDSQGRTRIERTFPAPAGAVAGPATIEINDPVSGAHYTLHERNHTAYRISLVDERPPAPPHINAQLTPHSQSEGPQRTRESLGTQTIEGIVAEGTRMTSVYPPGSIGNDRPITVVTETWRSPELNLTVFSEISDPRSGETTSRLTNISRAEPDAALFQIPPDYEIVDAQAGGSNR
jgi:hypothetical protein